LTEQYSLFCQIGVESRKRRYSAESTEVISHDAGADEPLLWSVRTEEETHQLMRNCGDHFTSAEPFNEGISASINSALSQVMR